MSALNIRFTTPDGNIASTEGVIGTDITKKNEVVMNKSNGYPLWIPCIDAETAKAVRNEIARIIQSADAGIVTTANWDFMNAATTDAKAQ